MPGVTAEGLVKRFGDFTALAGVDFAVPEGSLVGLLGPNGAGKTTTIRILSTLLPFEGGRATVGGYDVVAHSQQVRSIIGLTGQYAAVDDDLTGRENLVLVGRLGRLPSKRAKARAAQLLELFTLGYAADRYLRTYSGGMRRRLDLAASLMVAPTVLFLDEPTTGLDPRSRLALWDVIDELKHGGTTIVLTTQYLEEADHLSDSISVIDAGRIIATGTSAELKQLVGGDVMHLQLEDRADTGAAVASLARVFELREHELTVDPELGTVVAPVSGKASALTHALRALDADGIAIDDISLRRPSLDDVFLELTGHFTADEDDAEPRREEQPLPRTRFQGRRD
jgi:ABC-2 type transport system ATP-binding protein